MAPALIDALGYPPPNRRLAAGVHRVLRAWPIRAAVYDVAALGTFPARGTHPQHRHLNSPNPDPNHP